MRFIANFEIFMYLCASNIQDTLKFKDYEKPFQGLRCSSHRYRSNGL